MNDNFGRTYAKLSELKPGDQIIVDECFELEECECKLPAFSKHTVHRRYNSFLDWFRRKPRKPILFIWCAEGYHDLEGQLDYDEENDDSLLGIYHAEGFNHNV